MKRLLRQRSAAFGAGLVLLVVLFALLGPLFTAHDPLHSDFASGIDTATGLPASVSAHHLLGTDPLFRDVLARLAYGARISLVIGVTATLISMAIGTVVGIVAGWFEGEWLDSAIMRAVDIGLSFPFLLLVMAIGAALERTSALTILLVLGLTGWLGTARIVRARTMAIRRLEFVEAARALGQDTPSVLTRHVFPNVLGPIVVIASAQVAQMIIAESVLAFLGAGVAPPSPTWGGMLAEGQSYINVAPRLVVAPAIAIFATVLGFNLLGEGLRDALDPRDASRTKDDGAREGAPS